MSQVSGARRSCSLARPHPRWRAVLLHALLAAAGCGGDAIIVGEGITAGDSASASAGSGGVAPSGISIPAECPHSPGERQALLGCWPTRHVGHWRGFLIGNPTYPTLSGKSGDFPLGDLVLSIEPFGAARLSFGDPAPFAPPEGAGDAYLCAGSSPDVGCPAADGIVPGYPYELEELEIIDASFAPIPRIAGELTLRIGERLSFGVPLEQPWRTWCELQAPDPGACGRGEPYGAAAVDCLRLGPAPESGDNDACTVMEAGVARNIDCGWLAARESAPCSCSEDGCAARGLSLGMSVRMSEDGQALRGSVLAPAGRELGHVEFLREYDP